jgi:hypothetical protein
MFMAFPRRMAALPRLLNPLVLPLTRRLPPLAVLHHRGRLSGRSYDTPVQAYATPEGWVVGLAYDHNAPFALNLLAAGGGEMTRAGRRYRITRAAPGWTRGSATLAGLGITGDACGEHRRISTVRRRPAR